MEGPYQRADIRATMHIIAITQHIPGDRENERKRYRRTETETVYHLLKDRYLTGDLL